MKFANCRFLPALALSASILLGSLPVSAYYQSSDEIALAVRPEGSDGNTVTVSAEDAKAGTTIHAGIYIEAERCELSIIGIKLLPDSKALTFVPDTLFPGTEALYDPKKTFTLPDGTAFESWYEPYCLGSFDGKNYNLNCFSFTVNPNPDSPTTEDGALNVLWMKGIGQATEFLGGKSDAYSFLEFDVKVAPETAPGTYHLDFVTTDDALDAERQRLTYVVSDDGTARDSEYHNTIPALKGLTIVVEGETAPGTLGDVDGNGLVNATDASMVLIYAAEAGAAGSASFSTDADENERLFRQADVNADGKADASDAAVILLYAAAVGAGQDVEITDLV